MWYPDWCGGYSANMLPDINAPITDEADLEERLSRPTPGTVRAMGELDGDLLILGAGGKMGPSLARMARRSLDEAGNTKCRVIAVSRFGDRTLAEQLQSHGVDTLACDLLDSAARSRLPAVPNVLSMLGHKFSQGDPPGKHWVVNVQLIGSLAEQFRDSRIVAFSSGNVYPFTPITEPQPTEATPCGPRGEYAMTAWGRERVIEYVSSAHSTPACLLRLNYAVELRYGILVDLATQLLAGQTIDLGVPQVNLVWQGYANAVALQSFALANSPAGVLNITGTQRHKVHDLACALAKRLNVEPQFSEHEGSTALLNDATRCHEMFGKPEPETERLIDWVADWMLREGRTYGKPTKFQVSDGRF